MHYKMNIAGLDRELKLFPVNENLQIAAFVILSDVEITQAAARELLAKAPNITPGKLATTKGQSFFLFEKAHS